jgi:hypothetical protein
MYRKLGYSGVANPTDKAIENAIDNFGEVDGRYGRSAMECARELDKGNFTNAYGVLYHYNKWVALGRP